VRFLTVLYPVLAEDENDRVKIERVDEGAKLTFPDGRIHVIAIKGEGAQGQVKRQGTDAEIAWHESTAAGKLNACFFARGARLACGSASVQASAKVNALALDLRRPEQLLGYISAPEKVSLTLRVGAACRQAALDGKPLNITHSRGAIVLHGLQGHGILRLECR
jgi:hypothetical protein